MSVAGKPTRNRVGPESGGLAASQDAAHHVPPGRYTRWGGQWGTVAKGRVRSR